MRSKAIVNIDNLRYNLDLISEKIDKEKIMLVVKANAYGMGAKEIVKFAIKYGIKFYAVATIEEAMEIRKIDENIRILILSLVELEYIEFLVKNNIDITISRFEEIEYILSRNIKGNFHIAYDTGMGRIGFDSKNIEKALNMLKPIGMFSHLTSADSNEEFTKLQYERFIEIADRYDIKYKHFLNSFGTENYNSYFNEFNLYRIGILAYGGELNNKYKPVMTLKGRVSFVKKLNEDWNIGYSNTFEAKKGDIIVTVSMGYADGLFRFLSNKGYVYFNNRKYKIIGNICMDQFMVLGDENIQVGDFVEIFGENILVKDVAKSIGTISYELLCAVSNRVERVYKGG